METKSILIDFGSGIKNEGIIEKEGRCPNCTAASGFYEAPLFEKKYIGFCIYCEQLSVPVCEARKAHVIRELRRRIHIYVLIQLRLPSLCWVE